MKPVYVQGIPPDPGPETITSAIRNIILKATDNLSWLKEGETVLLKPALNSPDPYPSTTHPLSVSATAELLAERGATVVIGDQSGIEHVLHHPGGVLHGRTIDNYARSDEGVFSTRMTNENEETLTDAGGSRHTIVTKKSLYVTGNGEEFLVGMIRDISERKQMETALREVNKKLNILSGITRHDIRNQLLSLSAYLELSKETLGDAAITSECIIKEERAAHAIERQITFTGEYQDLGAGAPAWQDISSCLNLAVAALPVRDIRVMDEISGREIYADLLFEKVFYTSSTTRSGTEARA